MTQQERAVTTRDQIMAGAAEAFERSGFAGASLGDIIKAAGTTKGALYFHFDSKRALALAVVAEHHRRAMSVFTEVNDLEVSSIERLIIASHELVRRIGDDPMIRAGIRLSLEFSNTSKRPGGLFEDWLANTRRLVQAAIDERDIVSAASADTIAEFLVPAFTGLQMISTAVSGRADIDERIDGMWMVVLPGLVPADRQERIARIRSARWSPTEGEAGAPGSP